MEARTITATTRSYRTSYGARSLSVVSCAKLLVVFFLSTTTLSIAGCRSGVSTELLERELRMHENRIYELEDHLEDCHDVTETYRQENEKLQQQLNKQNKTTTTPSHSGNGRKFDYDPPKIEEEVPSDMDFSPPVIEGENEDLSSRSPAPKPTGVPEDDAPEDTLPLHPVLNNDPTSTDTPKAVSVDRPISSDPEELPLPVNAGLPSDSPTTDAPLTKVGPIDRILLHQIIGPSRPPAPEGLVLQAVIEPRHANGEPIRTAGDISLMVLAPHQSGPASRLGRWNFSGDDQENDAMWRCTRLGSGLHIEVPIPANLPDDTYELWARLVTPEGKKFLTSVEFDVNWLAMAAKTEPTAPLSPSTITGSPTEEPTPAMEEAGSRSADSVKARLPNQTAVLTKAPDQHWHRDHSALPQPVDGPLIDASRWSGTKVASEPKPPSSASPPAHQASRLRWSPYR